MATKQKIPPFDYTLDFEKIDFRKNPELYDIGRGEQGVLLIEPYKSEILPYWKFKTPLDAEKSSNRIYELYSEYKNNNDFVGMDMARKFLQMGYTRSRRYANHKSGKKYDVHRTILPNEIDEQKAESARIFYPQWIKVIEDVDYLRMKKEHITLILSSQEMRKKAPRRKIIASTKKNK